MSFNPGSWRPLARGGSDVTHFRGAVSAPQSRHGFNNADPQMLGEDRWGQIGTLLHRAIGNGQNQALVGITALGAGGAALGGCTVNLHFALSGVLAARTVSDASGNFRFDNPGTGPFSIRMYLPGSPDVAGVSANNLVPT